MCLISFYHQLCPYYRALALAQANAEGSPQRTPRHHCNAQTLTPKGRHQNRLITEESLLNHELQSSPRKAWASRLYLYSNTSTEAQRKAATLSQDKRSLEDEIEAYLLDSQVTESSIAFWQVSNSLKTNCYQTRISFLCD